MGRYWYRFLHNDVKSQVLVQAHDERQARHNGLTLASTQYPGEVIEGITLEKVD